MLDEKDNIFLEVNIGSLNKNFKKLEYIVGVLYAETFLI